MSVAESAPSVGINGHADAQADQQSLTANVRFFGESREQMFRQSLGCRRLWTVGNDDGELVAAQARQESARQPLACRRRLTSLQQIVADRVAEDVVDLLEAVEVDTQNGKLAAGLFGFREGRGQYAANAARFGRSVSGS